MTYIHNLKIYILLIIGTRTCVSVLGVGDCLPGLFVFPGLPRTSYISGEF